MKEIQTGIDERPRHGFSVDDQMDLLEMPSPWPHKQRGDLVAKLVHLARLGFEANRLADRVIGIDLPVKHVLPTRRVGVLKIGHKRRGARVESIDHHLALDRPGDFDPTIPQIGRWRGNPPLGRAHVGGFWQKSGKHTLVDLSLAIGTTSEQLQPSLVEATMERRQKRRSLRRLKSRWPGLRQIL